MKLSKEQLAELIEKYDVVTADDLAFALKDLFSTALEEMLEAELDTQLGYEKHSKTVKSTRNRRNGKSKKTVRSSEFGEVELSIPRDRNSEFEPQVVEKNQTSLPKIEDRIIFLYAKGLSTRDIQEHLEELYGINVSPTLISNVTNKLLPTIQEWQSRPLEAVYPIVFLDAIHYKVRHEGQVINKAAYVVLGVNLEGKKDILGIWIGENETSKFWLLVLGELKNRGVQDILIACTDNLTGFSEAILAVFPKTEIQKCIIHQIRNSTRYVGYKDLKQVTAALKLIYTAPTEEAALQQLDNFEKEWDKTYPLISRSWRANWHELATFFKYPPGIRKIIYTTNIIESFHRQLRKVTKSKSVFPSDESLLKMLFLVTRDVTKKWTSRMHHWGQILAQFAIFFEDRVTNYLQ